MRGMFKRFFGLPVPIRQPPVEAELEPVEAEKPIDQPEVVQPTPAEGKQE